MYEGSRCPAKLYQGGLIGRSYSDQAPDFAVTLNAPNCSASGAGIVPRTKTADNPEYQPR
jgi:hypothetical protein